MFMTRLSNRVMEGMAADILIYLYNSYVVKVNLIMQSCEPDSALVCGLARCHPCTATKSADQETVGKMIYQQKTTGKSGIAVLKN